MNNKEVLQDKIYKNSKGFVNDYKVLNTYQNQVYIKAEVLVDVKKDGIKKTIQNDLKLIGNNPRIAVIFNLKEDYGIDINEDVFITQLNSDLLNAGFNVVSLNQIQKNINQEQKERLLNNDFKVAQTLGNQLNAQILLIANSQVEDNDYEDNTLFDFGMDLRGATAHTGVTAIDTANSKVLFAETYNNRGVGGSLNSASQKALNKTSKKLIRKAKNGISENIVDNEKNIILKIDAVNNQSLTNIKDNLLGIKGVNRIYFRNYQNGLATFEVLTSNISILNFQEKLTNKLNASLLNVNPKDLMIKLKVNND